MKSLIFIFISLSFCASLSGQFEAFQIERFNKQLDVVISDPYLSTHWPVGLIYKDTSELAFTNLSDLHLRIADGPIGYQFVNKNVLFTEVKKDQFSINRFDNPFDQTVWVGPSRVGQWGPRTPGSFGSLYDFNTWGNIYTIDDQSRKLSELTVKDNKGALKLYRYPSLSPSICGIVTIDNSGNPVWTTSGGIIIIGSMVQNGSLLKRIKELPNNQNSTKDNSNTKTENAALKIKNLLPEITVTMDDGTKAINHMAFGPLAIQAIKEQQEIIETLEERIERLEKLIK